MIKMMSPLELNNSQITELIQSKDEKGGRAVAQRLSRTHVRNITGAAFDTPFLFDQIPRVEHCGFYIYQSIQQLAM